MRNSITSFTLLFLSDQIYLVHVYLILIQYFLILTILQSPFNVLTYSLIGDDAATTVFQINPNTGVISTRPTTNLTQTIGNFVVILLISYITLV